MHEHKIWAIPKTKERGWMSERPTVSEIGINISAE